MTDRIVLFGAGGHAKVVLEALRASRDPTGIAVVDDAPAGGRVLLGVPLAGDRAWLATRWLDADVMPAIGNNRVRAELLEWLSARSRGLATVVHPRALQSPSASIAGGSFVAAGAVVNADSVVAEGVIVNTGAIVDHDCRIGLAAHVAPGATLCGGVRIGARTLIGAGATVTPGVIIGDDVLVKAGATVTRDVPNGSHVGGD